MSAFLLTLLLVLSITLGQLPPPPPGPAIYVNEKASSGGNGQSWDTAFQDLQSALAVAKDQQQIWIAQGTYYPTTSKTDRNATFLISVHLSIYGGFIGTEKTVNERPNPLVPTILSGNIGNNVDQSDNSYHVITFTQDESVFDGLIIANGCATDDSYSNYMSCDTCFGGGFWAPCDESHPVKVTINQCTFINNTALSGGGIFSMCNPHFTITNSVFENNKAIFGAYKGGYGGGFMFAYMGDITVSNTSFTSNSADGGGGGAHCDYGMECIFSECTFEGNTVNKGNGAAISLIDRDSQRGFSQLGVTSSTFTNNIAGASGKSEAGYGGAIYLFDNNAHGMINSSIFNTNNGNLGGAMSFYGQSNCPGCCSKNSGNTFNGNTANNDVEYDNCYNHGFDSQTAADITPDPLKYLQLLDNQKSSIQPPPNVVPPPSANIVYVNKAASSGGDGSSWSKAFDVLQDGIDSAENILKKDSRTTVEIWVAGSSDYNTNKYIPQSVPSWYNFSAPYYNAQKSKLLEIPKNVNLFGGFAGTETKREQRDWYKNPTLLDAFVNAGDQVYQVVYVRENVWIDGFMIANGYAFPGPPHREIMNKGILHKWKAPQLRPYKTSLSELKQTNPDQILFDPTPVRGAGIFSNVTYFGLANILFYSHFSTKGSGLYVLGNPNFTHNITGYNLGFVNNYAIDRGGSLAIDLYGEMNCIGCIFMNNLCSHKGGAVYSDFWSHNIFDECTFYNNTAYDSGGAIGMDAGYSSVTNSNFTQNNAFSEGGALYTGSYNPHGGGDFSRPNHYSFANNIYNDNDCSSGIDDHYLWTYDYWIDVSSENKQ